MSVAGSGVPGKTVLACLMHKFSSRWSYYQVRLVVPDNGIPFINYQQVGSLVRTKRPLKTIQFTDLLFADKKHDTDEEFAFSIYTIDKTITFIATDETTMNEWLTKIRELHSNLYPEFKRYDSIFDANLQDKELARTMKIQGQYRIALCRESLDLIPLLSAQDLQTQNTALKAAASESSSISRFGKSYNPTLSNNTSVNGTNSKHSHLLHLDSDIPELNHRNTGNFSYLQTHLNSGHTISSPCDTTLHHHHHHLPQHLPSHQRFFKRHPLLAARTIELVWRNIRRCGHTDTTFFIELGRQSQLGEGGLRMSMNNKPTAKQLHNLSVAAMKQASTTDDQYQYKAPRSRSGSSSDNAHRSQQSRSSSLVCLNSELSHNVNNNSLASAIVSSAALNSANIAMFPNHDNLNIEEDSGYLPMA